MPGKKASAPASPVWLKQATSCEAGSASGHRSVSEASGGARCCAACWAAGVGHTALGRACELLLDQRVRLAAQSKQRVAKRIALAAQQQGVVSSRPLLRVGQLRRGICTAQGQSERSSGQQRRREQSQAAE